MIILSLFDGISCGRVALDRAGIKIDKYFASEIDIGAIKIATYNYHDTVEIGDTTQIHYQNNVLYTPNGTYNIPHIDLIMVDSPCADFSSIGYSKGMASNNIEIHTLSQYLDLKQQGAVFEGQSYLFWEYIRLLKEVQPTYFLLENVVMSQKWEHIINDALGIMPLKINS